MSRKNCAKEDIGKECMCEDCINDLAANVAAMGADDFE